MISNSLFIKAQIGMIVGIAIFCVPFSMAIWLQSTSFILYWLTGVLALTGSMMCSLIAYHTVLPEFGVMVQPLYGYEPVTTDDMDPLINNQV